MFKIFIDNNPKNWVPGEIEPYDSKRLSQRLQTGYCPECGSNQGFYEGPRGGLAQNIFCANNSCEAGFNVIMFPDKLHVSERIRVSKLVKYPINKLFHIGSLPKGEL